MVGGASFQPAFHAAVQTSAYCTAPKLEDSTKGSALVTVQLQLCSDLLFSFGQAEGVCHELYRLLGACFIGGDAVVIEIPDHGQI